MTTKFILGLILGISLAAPIGLVSVEVIRRGSVYGFSQAFLTGFGAAAADTCYLILVSIGLRNVPYLKIVGSLVLTIMGVLSIFGKAKSKPNSRKSFFAGYTIAMLSPHDCNLVGRSFWSYFRLHFYPVIFCNIWSCSLVLPAFSILALWKRLR